MFVLEGSQMLCTAHLCSPGQWWRNEFIFTKIFTKIKLEINQLKSIIISTQKSLLMINKMSAEFSDSKLFAVELILTALYPLGIFN